MRELLEIEGERDEDVPSDGHEDADNGVLVEFRELDFDPIFHWAAHGGLEVQPVGVGNEHQPGVNPADTRGPRSL